jgi:ribosomal protein S16
MFRLILDYNKGNFKIIRFKKKGIIKYPLYDIIVAKKNIRNRGLAIEKLGFFNPQCNVKFININNYRLSY